MAFKAKQEWLQPVNDELTAFIENTEDEIDRYMQQMKEMEKNVAVGSQLATERELNKELEAQLEKLQRQGVELDTCVKFGKLQITESDQNRLDHAKVMYEVAKEMTGVRFDFSAPPNLVKGYVKSDSRKMLLPFEIDTSSGGDSEALWSLMRSTVAPGWPISDKENQPYNK